MSDKPEIIFHDDVQLLDWGESRGTGPWIKLRLADPDDLDKFRGMDTATMKKTGHILSMTLATGDIAAIAQDEPQQKSGHGAFWRDLMRSGFFLNVPVLQKIGTEAEFESWVRLQPSVLDGAQDWDEAKGRGQCVVAHVRRVAKGSGTAQRPPFFAVPLTHEQHAVQHQAGEFRAFKWWRPDDDAEAGVWFERQAEQMQRAWGSKRLAMKLNPEAKSRSEISPDEVFRWANEAHVWQYVPTSLKRAGMGELVR